MSKARTPLNTQPIRYAIVTGLGLIIDLGLALLLARSGASRPIASATGLLAGATSNFFLHRSWTFEGDKVLPILRQLSGFVLALVLTMAIRLLTLTLIRHALPAAGDAIALITAVCISFICNFLLLKRYVFARGKTL
ncbi:GtrA family protein [Paracoccus zhejiangensis]|uniref:GtrA/DPMS transmembrane domain-containing protein n=1 Tax=Paracoccus zhejiangensis TaxID=1077935 RepID=A0A2H5F0U8_9RHOB|nr:GtrA family protein [Paracoccus zhejiangensis]AUH65157.1 hypothetical protein CX676_14045 [Paracoccus zhejiangensis]